MNGASLRSSPSWASPAAWCRWACFGCYDRGSKKIRATDETRIEHENKPFSVLSVASCFSFCLVFRICFPCLIRVSSWPLQQIQCSGDGGDGAVHVGFGVSGRGHAAKTG